MNRYLSWMTPIGLRRAGLMLYMRALVFPLAWLKEKTLYQMQHDCRVIYMEKVLNERFAMPGYNSQHHEDTKIIYIDEGNVPEDLYIFLKSEPDEPIWLDDDEPFLITTEEYNAEYYDFVVVFPAQLDNEAYTFSQSKARYLIDYYKLAGKKYIITQE